ncbi:MAG: hypothetical protein KatS3mg060_3626 [Dehalococcoidia bacterium]|nr:MAG: hypothetical protein KatS3mg060_3626 [Dehalococcoidia bacterium]
MGTQWCANGHEFDEALAQCPVCGAGPPRPWDQRTSPPSTFATSGATEPYAPPSAQRGRVACLLPLLAGVGTFCVVLAVLLIGVGWLLIGGGGSLAGVAAEVLPANPLLGPRKESVEATATARAVSDATAETRRASPTVPPGSTGTPAPTETPSPAETAASPTPGAAAGAPPPAEPVPPDGSPAQRTITIASPPGVPVRCVVEGSGVETGFDLPGGQSTTLVLAPGVYTFRCSSRAGMVGFTIPVFTIVIPESGDLDVPAFARPFLIVAIS